MNAKNPEEERPEPRIEVDADLEELEEHTVQDWKSRPTAEKKSITRWVIGPILIAALAGLGYAFWLVWRMEPSHPKTAPLAAELSALKGEMQKMTPEMEKLKKELEELRIENKTTVEQLKGFQTQLAAMAKKVETASARKAEPAPAKKPEPVAVKKPEPATAKKPEPPAPKKAETPTAKKAEPPAPAKAPAPAAKKPASKTFVYKVKPGENVYSIGRKFKVDPDDILRLNELPAKTVLQAGQLLTIQSEASR